MKKQLLFTILLSLSFGFLSAQIVIDEFTGNVSSGVGEASGQPDWGAGVSTITYESDQLKSDYTWLHSDWFPRSVWYHFDDYQDFSNNPVMMIRFMVADNFNDSIAVRFDLYGDGTVNGNVEDTVEANARPWSLYATNGEWYEVSDDFTANDRWACTYWGGGIDESPVDPSRIKGFEAFSHFGNGAYDNQAGTLYIDYIKMAAPTGVGEVIYGNEAAFGLAVYPNPTSSVLTVNSQNVISTVTVYDVAGRVIESLDNVNLKRTQLNVSEYNAGLYFVNVQDSEGKSVSKKIQVK